MKKKKTYDSLQKLTAGGIILSAMTLVGSLFYYFQPLALENQADSARPGYETDAALPENPEHGIMTANAGNDNHPQPVFAEAGSGSDSLPSDKNPAAADSNNPADPQSSSSAALTAGRSSAFTGITSPADKESGNDVTASGHLSADANTDGDTADSNHQSDAANTGSDSADSNRRSDAANTGNDSADSAGLPAANTDNDSASSDHQSSAADTGSGSALTDTRSGHESAPAANPGTESEAVPYIAASQKLGNISDLTAAASIYEEDTSLYLAMLDTELGPMIYYNQGDKRWGNYLYGGADPMRKYGCGPTAIAMIVSSFSPQGYNLTPADLADWATVHGGYAPQSGSYHSMIPNSLSAFGLHVEGVELYSEETAADLLRSGHILVALMGKGALTKNGHFVIITKILDNGNVYIADPNSFKNSTKEWNLAQLMNELKGAYDSGGPLWAVRLN